MNMDEQTSRRKQQWGMRTTLIAPPPENGPKRYAFRIRRRRFTFRGCPSLLVSDHIGVWSVAHGRYIRRTRRHRYLELRLEINPIYENCKKLVREYGMHGWPEFRPVAGEVAALWQRLLDMYWDARLEELKVYRKRWRRARAARPAKLAALAAVVMAVIAFVLIRVLLLGRYGGWANFCMGSAYLAAVYLVDTAWHAINRSQVSDIFSLLPNT